VAEEATLKDLMNATVQGRKWLKGADKDWLKQLWQGSSVLLLIW
jgi:hypothetical protein